MMRGKWSLACVVVVAAGAPVMAQDQITAYAPDFFAAARPATAMDMINRLPGFSFDGGDSARGFSGNSGNVLINGKRPASKNDSLSTVLSRIVADQVERIEVISGGAPGIDMQGKAVIANVIGKVDTATSLVTTFNFNFFAATQRGIPSGQAQFSHTDGVRSYNLGIRRDASYSEDMGEAGITKYDAMGNGAFTRQMRRGSGGTTGLNGAVQTPFLGGDLSLNGSASLYEFANGTTYFYAAGPEEFASTSRNQKGELGANYQIDFGGPVLDMVALQRLGSEKSTSILGVGAGQQRQSSLRDTGESILRAALRLPLNDTLTVEGGAEGAYNTLEGETRLTNGGVNVPVPASKVEVNEKRGEVFGQMTWQAQPDLTLDAGVRAEYSTIAQPGGTTKPRSLFFPKPRAALSWAVDPATQLRLRAEREVGQLNFNDFVSSANLTQGNVTAGNPDLQPDNRWVYEAVYERRFWERGAVTVSLAHEQIDDLLDNKPTITPTGAFDVRGNIGSGVNTRLSVDATIPTDKFGVPGGLLNVEGEWRKSELTDPVTGLKRTFSNQDPQRYEARFSQDIDTLRSTWDVSYYNGWHDTNYRLRQANHNYGGPGVHASWTYRPSTDLNFTFSANNIINSARKRESDYFSGLRGASTVARSETETSANRARFYFSVRKTFN